MRGAFTAADAAEWCDRRLLARMHRGTRDKLRADIQPVPPAQFMRFLFRWHQLASDDRDERREGEGGTGRRAAPARRPCGTGRGLGRRPAVARASSDYMPAMLDKLCAVGRVAWWRPTRQRRGGSARRARSAARRSCCANATPCRTGSRPPAPRRSTTPPLSGKAARGARGAAHARRQLLRRPAARRRPAGRADRTGAGRAGGAWPRHLRFSFAGLRALVMPADKRNKLAPHVRATTRSTTPAAGR